MASKKEQEKALRLEMYRSAMSMNKVLTEDYMDNLSTKAVIGLTNPLYRDQWQRKLDIINGVEIVED